MKHALLAAAVAATAGVSFAGAQIVTDDLVYNFAINTAQEGVDWQSTAPGSNTTAIFNTETNFPEGVRDANLVPVTSARGYSQAYSFNNMPTGGGAESRLDIDPSEGLPFVDSFAGLAPNASFEVNFRPDDLVGDEVIFETGGTARGLTLATSGAMLYAFSKQAGGGDPTELILSAPLTAAATAMFNQVVFTTNGVDSHNLYLNGVLVDSSTLNYGDFAGGNVAALAASDPGGLGGLDGDGGGITLDDASNYSALVGDIADFRAYDDVLTPAEVAQNFATLVPEPAALAVLGVAGLGLLRRRTA